MLKLTSKKTSKEFYFDQVFGALTTQEKLFDHVKDFFVSFLHGYDVCIFAFGPTGTGKTYTIEGDVEDVEISHTSGIIPRGFEMILKKVKEESYCLEQKFKILCCCFEIYNEEVYDLLHKNKNKLKIINGSPSNAIQREIKTMQDASDMMKKCHKNRETEKTENNVRSSRSHLIYKITIVSEVDKSRTRNMYIVDLAGSEKFSQNTTKNVKKREKTQKEAIFINKSLTTLRRIITEKKVGIDKLLGTRESKLTHIIHSCLEGDGKLLMISNVGEDSKDGPMTKETLKFSSI